MKQVSPEFAPFIGNIQTEAGGHLLKENQTDTPVTDTY